jgi:hypothetical protein
MGMEEGEMEAGRQMKLAHRSKIDLSRLMTKQFSLPNYSSFPHVLPMRSLRIRSATGQMADYFKEEFRAGRRSGEQGPGRQFFGFYLLIQRIIGPTAYSRHCGG